MRFEYLLRLDQIGTKADCASDLAEELLELGDNIYNWVSWTEIEIEPITDDKNRTTGFLFHTEDPTVCEEFPDFFEAAGSLFEDEEEELDEFVPTWEEDSDIWG